MSSSNTWLLLGALSLILVLSFVQQSARPVTVTTRVEAGADAGASEFLREALKELQELRAQVSAVEGGLQALQARTAEAQAAPGPQVAPGDAVAPPRQVARPPAAQEGSHSSFSSTRAPTSFIDVVRLDDMPAPEGNYSVLAPLTSSQPTCGMLLFRHIEKTGGTTFRMHMVALHRCGWHVWGYKGTIRLCNKGRAEWEMLLDPSKRPQRADGPILPRLSVESHAEVGDYQRVLEKWVPLVQRWHGTCGMWLVTVIRDPLKRAVSHFSYNKKTRKGVIDESIKNFTQYMQVQLDHLARPPRSHDADQFMQRHILLPKLLELERAGKAEGELHAYIGGELDKFDVVGIFENYTASMLLIARATGLPLSKYSAPSTVKNRDIKPHRDFVKQIWAEELATEAQKRFFMEALALDYWLYNDAARRFNALVAQGGEALAAQLRELMRADPDRLDGSLEGVCKRSDCPPELDKEQSTNRFVWKDQQCWPPGERELASCGKDPHLNPNFDFALCG